MLRGPGSGLIRIWPYAAALAVLLTAFGFAEIPRSSPDLSKFERRSNDTGLFRWDSYYLKRGNPDLPEVALTFDDGPHPGSLGTILETLRHYGVHATFFLVGSRIDENPSWAQRIVEEGHEVGNHTYDHARLTGLSPEKAADEIRLCGQAFERATGLGMSILRPPGMRFNRDVLGEIVRQGYVTIGWTDAAKDFETETHKIDGLTVDEIGNRVMAKVRNGSIILLHDTPQTAQALPRIVSLLKVSGFKLVTIPEMLEHLPEPIRVRTNASARLSPPVSR